MSRPHSDVATSFASHLFSSSSNHSSLLQPNFLISVLLGHDLKLMSRLGFLLLSSSSGRDINDWS